MAKKKETESPEDKLLTTARKRFDYCIEQDQKNRERALEAIKFRDGEQWPDKIKKERETDPEGARPCLVVDKTNQYINQVKNDQRQNRPAIKVRPVDDKGDKAVAEILQGIIRHIEDSSSADFAYDTAFEHSVDGGFGYFRILTEFCEEDSFDQDIKIKRIRNRFSVYLDPDHQEPDGSDSQYGFVTEFIDKDEYKRQFPGKEPLDFQTDGKDESYRAWMTAEKVRIAEYFYLSNESKTLLLLDDGTTVFKDALQEVVEDRALQGLPPPEVVKSRETAVRKVHWCKIDGKQKLETKEWAGKYIPVVEVVGNELDVEGERRLSGLIKSAMDPQRIHNFASSAFVENVALAPRAPWTAAEGQMEGHEDDWKTSNRRNIAVLEWKPTTYDNGTPVPQPQRQMPPGISPGWQQVLQNSEHDIQASMGMYSASLGEPSNEKSGKAILARQREGDTATFHYIDNLSRSIRHCGRILVDLIPKIYDTQRIARIIGEDGKPDMVELNPEQDAPVVEMGKKKIYNLHVGKYDVSVTVGPSYTTKRQEAAESMVELTRASPELMQVAGDVMIRNMDWPGADQIADRLKAMLPPAIQKMEAGKENQDSTIQMQATIQTLTAQLEEAKAMMAQMQQAVSEKEIELAKAEQDLTGQAAGIKTDLAQLNADKALLNETYKRITAELKLKQMEAEYSVPSDGSGPQTDKNGSLTVVDSSFAGPINAVAEMIGQNNAMLHGQGEALTSMANALTHLAMGVARQSGPKRITLPDGSVAMTEPVETRQ